MEALRQEIRDEMKTLRVNKKHVYGLLMRLVDEIDGGAPPAPAPAPVKKVEPAPVKKVEPAPVKKVEPAPAKKVVRKTTKKKAEVAEPALK